MVNENLVPGCPSGMMFIPNFIKMLCVSAFSDISFNIYNTKIGDLNPCTMRLLAGLFNFMLKGFACMLLWHTDSWTICNLQCSIKDNLHNQPTNGDVYNHVDVR